MAVVHRISLEHGMLQPLGPNDPTGIPLAADQLEAVAAPTAGARIIAPAGSGKTRVLTERARLLLQGWGLPSAAIALVAYNVRAATEMKVRLADVAGVRVRTLNALSLRLSGRKSTIEEMDVRRLLGDLITFPKRAETDPVAPWIEALGRVQSRAKCPTCQISIGSPGPTGPNSPSGKSWTSTSR
jgi:DNA helicase-2/ATP-dependent DNA helicase PcrA